MEIGRRQFLKYAGTAAAVGTLTSPARALDYPTRQVRLLVGFAAGGATDTLARIFGQWLADRLGQPFIVENRPGAASNLATEALVNSPPDGYTLLVAAPGVAISASLYQKLNYNFIRDTAPVAGLVWIPNALAVHPSLPVKTVPEFIAYAKANPGKIGFGSSGIGSSPHMGGELFKMMTGVDIMHVPYRGDAPAVTDLIGGQIQCWFGPLLSSLEHIRSGGLRAIAVTSAQRSPVLPDLPTIAESVPGYSAFTWDGVSAPKNTPAEIVNKLNKEINAALADAGVGARLREMAAVPLVGSPSDWGKFVADETEKWAKVVKFTGVTL